VRHVVRRWDRNTILKRGLGAVVARRVSALFVSDLTGIVDGGEGCISPATLLEIGAVADGRIKLRL
jgi:hypothetical protein